MLKFLWGMLAGYLVCSVEVSLFLIKRGYRSVSEIPNND